MTQEELDEGTKRVARRLSGDEQVCAECGNSVKPGSGKFVNRTPILDGLRERVKVGYPHPEGAYICAECRKKMEKEVRDATDRAYGQK